MPRKRHPPEQIIRKLREAKVALAQGQKKVDVVRKLGITEQTYTISSMKERWSRSPRVPPAATPSTEYCDYARESG